MPLLAGRGPVGPKHWCRAIVALLLVLAASSSSQAAFEAGFRFDESPGRLPKAVVPLDYRVALEPDIASKTFAGTEVVTLDVRSATSTIAFDTSDEALDDVTLDGIPAVAVNSNNEDQRTTLHLDSPIGVGRHVLAIRYRGKIQTVPSGLFEQTYLDRTGETHVMLSTQLESIGARRLFPCWDEPSFRATYQLTVTVPAQWEAVSNMPIQSRSVHDGTATTTFRRTPKMSTYLLELSAGDLTRIHATDGIVDHGVWTLRGEDRSATYALDVSRAILHDYESYFGYDYPLPKLDHVAVPGTFGGAMENWGAITYGSDLLLSSEHSPPAHRQTIFATMAHEIAHQWNGNLVTMAWWDDLWLNESFASWMAAKETAFRNPGWQWLERIEVDKEAALRADARSSSHPIRRTVVDDRQADAAFDEAITYDKGAAFLRMLEAFLGPDTFRAGVRKYVKEHAYSNATSGDLWNALTAASGKDVGAIARDWIEQPGFPLLSVTAACDTEGNRTIRLVQRRFLTTGSEPLPLHWDVPLDIRSGTHGEVKKALLTTDGQLFSAGRCSDALSVNASAVGFFRASYDVRTFAANAEAFAALPALEKIPMLDDEWALAQAGQAPLSRFLGLASRMSVGDDVDVVAWTQIVGALDSIRAIERGTAGYNAFARYGKAVVAPVFRAIGWDAKYDDGGRRALRRSVITLLASFGDDGVIAEARRRFATFASADDGDDPDDQTMIFTIVGMWADQRMFNQMKELLALSHGPRGQLRCLFSLAAARDPKIAEQVLQLALSDAPPDEGATRAYLVNAVAAAHPALAWEFLERHDADVFPHAGPERTRILTAIPTQYWRSAPLPALERFVTSRIGSEGRPLVVGALDRARASADLSARWLSETDAYTTGLVARDQDHDREPNRAPR